MEGKSIIINEQELSFVRADIEYEDSGNDMLFFNVRLEAPYQISESLVSYMQKKESKYFIISLNSMNKGSLGDQMNQYLKQGLASQMKTNKETLISNASDKHIEEQNQVLISNKQNKPIDQFKCSYITLYQDQTVVVKDLNFENFNSHLSSEKSNDILDNHIIAILDHIRQNGFASASINITSEAFTFKNLEKVLTMINQEYRKGLNYLKFNILLDQNMNEKFAFDYAFFTQSQFDVVLKKFEINSEEVQQVKDFFKLAEIYPGIAIQMPWDQQMMLPRHFQSEQDSHQDNTQYLSRNQFYSCMGIGSIAKMQKCIYLLIGNEKHRVQTNYVQKEISNQIQSQLNQSIYFIRKINFKEPVHIIQHKLHSIKIKQYNAQCIYLNSLKDEQNSVIDSVINTLQSASSVPTFQIGLSIFKMISKIQELQLHIQLPNPKQFIYRQLLFSQISYPYLVFKVSSNCINQFQGTLQEIDLEMNNLFEKFSFLEGKIKIESQDYDDVMIAKIWRPEIQFEVEEYFPEEDDFWIDGQSKEVVAAILHWGKSFKKGQCQRFIQSHAFLQKPFKILGEFKN